MRALLVLLALIGVGCAREAPPASMAPSSAYPDPALGYGWPPTTVGAPAAPPPRPLVAGVGLSAGPEASPRRSTAPAAARERPPPVTRSGRTHPAAPRPSIQPIAAASIPAGESCIGKLDSLGIKYRRLDSKRGVETPVSIIGPIGGIQFDGGTGESMVCDCRLAVAFQRVAPILAELGVSSLRYSGAYSYRMSRVGRLSLHAHGLAIDVHELVVRGQRLSVSKDFARGLSDGCSADAPALNQVACRLKTTGLFQELLTPDYNADHHDHLHLAIAPLARSPGAQGDATAKAAARTAKDQR